MEIIDAHIHLFDNEHLELLARRAGYEGGRACLEREYARLGVVKAVVMGNRDLDTQGDYPEFARYCVGLDGRTGWDADLNATYDSIERHFKAEKCVGVKLYPGYNFLYVSDKRFGPVYELAARYGKPVAVHTGETAMPQAKLKYCHPLTLDSAAADFPRVSFVMCHLGNPWFTDAAVVIKKNKNISADLSGMLEGRLDMPEFFKEYGGYVNQIKTWLTYLGDYGRLMYATDWPLVNMENYIDFVAELIPERHHEAVFALNARRIYEID